jgi:hypothetical protein
MAKKKKKASLEERHKQIQTSVQFLPQYIEQQQKEGKRVRAFMLKYVTGPMLRLMNRAMSAKRYRGEDGKKLQQTEKMRRHLEQRQMAMKHVEGYVQKTQRQRGSRPR